MDIPREKAVEIYNKFDELHRLIIRAGGGAVGFGGVDVLIDSINRADRLADDMERLWSEILTPEERGDDGT